MEISISWSLRMYTWTIILKENSKSFDLAKKLFKILQIEKNLFIFKIHSDHDKDFENTNLFFYDEQGIHQDFSAIITP